MSDKADKKGKDKKDKKGKADASGGPSVAAHPRASYQVRKAKGWGGMAGFGIAAYLSYKAGVPTVDLGMRAIIAGMVGDMLAWGCAVTVWRQLVMAELRAVVERAAPAKSDTFPARSDGARSAAPAPEAVADPAGGS